MLNNDRLSDVKFVVANSNGESESKQVIAAHKFILAIGSPVFEAMFYGELLESRDTIELPDCDYESLLELFRYLVLPSSLKYEEKALEDRCWKVIENQTEAFVKSEGFETIERSLLEAIVARDTLTIEEVALFKALDGWATRQCEKQGLAAEGQIKEESWATKS
ncbi:unnamed protein product [Porites lobata]|uniref:BTB domain-containing protein n=1 Tax=Porites lobata TaxID=104759 RepID=A0ABN8NLN3_9CNID|nr:unnamed protein product [Porites lobata]